MDDHQPIEEIHFIGDIGLYFEQMGLPRMAGRILGALLISDPPSQSITDLSARLHASKSSISIMATLLVERGLIERVASPIPRRDYYRFKPGGWIIYMRQWLGLMAGLHQITERGMLLLAGKPDPLKLRLKEAHVLFSNVELEFPSILQKIENKQTKSR